MIWQSEVWYCTTRLGRVHYCKLAVVTADQKAIAQIILRVLHLNTNAHNTHSVTREHNTRQDKSTKQSLKSSSVTHCNWTVSQAEMDFGHLADEHQDVDASHGQVQELYMTVSQCQAELYGWQASHPTIGRQSCPL